jgi:hypothetical protein
MSPEIINALYPVLIFVVVVLGFFAIGALFTDFDDMDDIP